MPISRQMEKSLITGLTVVAKAKFNKVRWNESADRRHASYRLYRYENEADADANVSAEVFGPILEAFYKDDDDLPHGQEYWYRVADVDQADVEGDLSDPASLEARGVQTADVEQDAITSVQLAPAAIYPSNYYRNPAGNLVPDYELLEVGEWTFKQWLNATAESTAVAIPGGNVSAALNASDAGWGGSDYTFTFFPSAPSGGVLWNVVAESKALIPIIANRRYKYGLVVSQPGASSTKFFNALYAEVRFWKTDAAGALILISSDYRVFSYGSGTFATVATLVGDVIAPAGATFASIRVRGFPTGGHTSQPSVKFGSPFVAELPKATDMVIPLVGNVAGATSFGSAGAGVQVQVIALTQGFGRLAYADFASVQEAVVSVAFRHTSGSAKDIRMEINIVDGSTLFATLYNSGVINIKDNELIAFTINASDIGSFNLQSNRYLEFRVYGSAAGNTIGAVQFTAQLYTNVN